MSDPKLGIYRLICRLREVFVMSKKGGKAYYAVGVGRETGIFNSWNECKSQVEGLQNPKYKKFYNLDEAKEFVNSWKGKNQSYKEHIGNGSNPDSSNQTSVDQLKGGMGQLNESSNQNQTLLQEKFDNCERKIDMCFGQVSSIVAGLTQARDEIRELRKMCLMKGNILMEGRNQSAKPVTNAKYLSTYNGSISGSPSHTKKKFSDEKMVDSEKDDLDVYQPPAKRKKDGDESSDTTCNTFDYDGAIKREKADYIGFTIDEDDYVIVYTDGACTSNGMGNAKAGIGIWFGDGHPMNVGRPFKGVPPTNNNAEIQAARIAIELALSAGIKKLRILTDSEFVINCATKWVQQWKEKGWITGSKSPVKNRVELEKLDRVMSKLSVRWEKVCAHSGVFGNEMADRLANNGAESYERQ
ncbi:UNVERIFIED_CONTAM: hypothetical protein PYX00_007313 [Menopon gallinae]|uniref:ribonuclease H n=1 Tax=Menopon gallinae TaxID=328185 RepID=A0AAW2HIL2_9NEOP